MNFAPLPNEINPPIEDDYQEPEGSTLRSGDEFELMGQKYRVHRVAKKNIVIRKIKTVNLNDD